MYQQDDKEDEDFNSLISELAGSGEAAPTRQSVYTPPPAAAEPAYQQKIGAREFGVGDIAMLGGILASLVAKKPGLDDAKWFKLADILELNFYNDILPIVTKAVTILSEQEK